MIMIQACVKAVGKIAKEVCRGRKNKSSKFIYVNNIILPLDFEQVRFILQFTMLYPLFITYSLRKRMMMMTSLFLMMVLTLRRR